jgi:hypothetical protein
MKQRVLARTGDFWWARLNATGDRLVCGNASLKVLALDQPGVWWPVSEIGRSGRWVDPRTVTYITPITGTTARRFTAAEIDGYNGRNAGGDLDLIAGNAFETNGSGAWASWLAPNRLAIGNTLISLDATGLHAGGPYFVSASLSAPRRFLIYNGGTFLHDLPLPPRANDWSVSEQGWIGYGYYWEARVLSPAGNDHDLTITPWRQESVPQIVHLPTGETWVWTATVRPDTQQPLVLGRPLGAVTCIVLDGFPAAGLSVVYADNHFVVAGHDDRGNLQVWTVTADEARVPLAPAAPARGDELWTDTAPIDLLPLIVGEPSRWPRHGSHDLHQSWDGRNFYLLKFGASDHWERWVLDGDRFFLREDRSQSGAGDYSFHQGTWFARYMSPGQWIDVPDNQIQRYEPTTCAVQSIGRFPYRVGLVQAWRRLDCGGDIGIVERASTPAAVLLAYDPGGPHDTIEHYLMVDGWGLVKWRVQAQDNPSAFNETVFNLLGGAAIMPTRGCYRALTAPLPEPKPMSLTVQQVHEAFRALPWDVDVAHLARFRDNVWKRDQGGDVPSRGALAYYHREVFAAIVERFDAMGRLPAGPPEQVFAEWDGAFTLGTDRAIAAYRREIQPDPEDNQDPR